MKVNTALRKQQQASTIDLKERAQKAEQLLGEIETCEQILAKLNESLSAVLGIGSTPAAEDKAPPVAACSRLVERRITPTSAKPSAIRPAHPAPGRPGWCARSRPPGDRPRWRRRSRPLPAPSRGPARR